MDPEGRGSAGSGSGQPEKDVPGVGSGTEDEGFSGGGFVSSPQRGSTSSFADAAPSFADMDSTWQMLGSAEFDQPEAHAPWWDNRQQRYQQRNDLSNIEQLAGSSSFPRDLEELPNACQLRGHVAPGLDAFEGSSHFTQYQGLVRQESLNLITAQIARDHEIERYSQEELRGFRDEMERFLFDQSDSLTLPNLEPQYFGTSGTSGTNPDPLGYADTPVPEVSSLSIGPDTEVDLSDASTRDSQGASEVSSPGSKRKLEGVSADHAGDPNYDGNSPRIRQRVQSSPAGRSPQSRIAIQTRTEVDVIDDGYKWRKYGQKPVKNSVHPRNYYKCTTANCPVRKRVERCTDDPSHVLTTYDGTHTHPETSPQTTDGSNPPRNVGCNLERMVDEDVSTSSAPVTPLGPPRVPSNYWPVQPNGLANLLLAGSQLPDQRRWSHPAAQQIFRLQFQTQYPLLFNMLNLMRTFPRARPPLVDPRMSPRLDSRALHAAQSYAMRTASGHINQDVVGPASAKALDPQNSSSGLGPSSSVPVSFSRAQQRLLWMRQLMGESILGEQRTGQHPASDSTTDN
ncbi:uncharacterized protein [Physcomitrium patens]|uniref:WRKY domain-containing protein n=1 Tax=Physcomitrium patens TaxID=3218 RepID=A0A7I4D3J7_PHYPA|nr:probable WRKY transcription factor 20 isoform X2 [Physcomitrium patens]|eukprot:XP_024367797.1 probable WRKY transcription factor 20 isoform X2 [Physcomitrella patens]